MVSGSVDGMGPCLDRAARRDGGLVVVQAVEGIDVGLCKEQPDVAIAT